MQVIQKLFELLFISHQKPQGYMTVEHFKVLEEKHSPGILYEAKMKTN